MDFSERQIARLPKYLRERVAEIWQEEDGCFEDTNGDRPSWWAELKDPWRWDDCTTCHEGTFANLKSAIKDAIKVEGANKHVAGLELGTPK